MRVREAKRRLEEELATEDHANAAYEAYRATGRMKNGRRFGSAPKPYTPPEQPAGRINVTDPDSRTLKTRAAFVRATTPRPSATSNHRRRPFARRSERRAQLSHAGKVKLAGDRDELNPLLHLVIELHAPGGRPLTRGGAV